MKPSRQTTLRKAVTLTGVGVHSGQPARLVLHPAAANHGIVFLRTGLSNGRERLIDARYIHVSTTELCTVLGDKDSGSVSTVEHLMAALVGLGVDNVLAEIDSPEMPILDGSSACFVDAIMSVGLAVQEASRRYIKVLRPVRIEHGRGFSELRPLERGYRLDVEIDFDSQVIGRQRKVMDLDPETFRTEISRARTFGFLRDLEKLRKMGLAGGSSLDNSVAIADDGIVNPGGLRYADEFVRHKMLDAVGDLALAGYALQGEYRSYCAGHRMNVAVLQSLFSDRANYAIVDAMAPRREFAYAEIGAGVAVPAYAPDLS
ncbi:UDP-3-O-acyl-N-acetylglucosamine deacetylase [Pseudochelatococcus contaminans]|uniref:UDP-3-O-acyl-N-acetylglucosamine deacetylase n=1 Tax=Pseudochelatococcus contaminans TaxID=1538103 RepID=A0A7W6EEK2_9HYPH|nr:UDP-3-O-acyl-N-acetylglucosamine deacetylase [Pseudochelatococcus contaminans]MBB3808263.1 UDP-3-O-[3-hydroxymyristoyl] N-acetylglucosamine deacetylase [Pseudochelatococcus contaminans]